MEPHYSTGKVARILGVARYTVRRWIREGRVKAVRVNGRWRIPESEIKKLLGVLENRVEEAVAGGSRATVEEKKKAPHPRAGEEKHVKERRAAKEEEEFTWIVLDAGSWKIT